MKLKMIKGFNEFELYASQIQGSVCSIIRTFKQKKLFHYVFATFLPIQYFLWSLKTRDGGFKYVSV